MFIVVAEEITGNHCPEMVLSLCSRTVGLHVVLMGQAMGQVGPEIEKLKGAQYR